MPIYSILWNQDPSGENVGGSYSQWLIQQQLRDEAKFVMLKSHANSVLPVKDRKKVFVPKRHFPAIPGAWGGISEEKTVEPISLDLAKKYFDVVDSPDKADFAFGLNWSGVINDDRVKKYK